jgi:hypothetical protein
VHAELSSEATIWNAGDNIKMGFKEIGCENVNWIRLALVNTNEHSGSIKDGEFLF